MLKTDASCASDEPHRSETTRCSGKTQHIAGLKWRAAGTVSLNIDDMVRDSHSACGWTWGGAQRIVAARATDFAPQRAPLDWALSRLPARIASGFSEPITLPSAVRKSGDSRGFSHVLCNGSIALF